MIFEDVKFVLTVFSYYQLLSLHENLLSVSYTFYRERLRFSIHYDVPCIFNRRLKNGKY